MTRADASKPQHTPLAGGAEFDFIRRVLRAAPMHASSQVRVHAGDDCAVIRGESIAISVDMAVEDVHFRRDWLSAEEIGYRSAAAALSDLAAMAARPFGMLVSIAVPAGQDDFAERVMAGVQDVATSFEAALIGGDVTRSTAGLVIDCVVLGDAARPVRRSGAHPGDEVWVTGTLGAAAAAVAAWREGTEPPAPARAAYARPTPRIAEAAWLDERVALHAMIDLSDGLAGDAAHLAAASGVCITLDGDAVPRFTAASDADDGLALRRALTGGDDYELCFAVPAGAVAPLQPEFLARFGIALTRVGSVQAGEGVRLRTADGRSEPLAHGGYDHFRTATS